MEIDKQTLKALSADARIKILKMLYRNRKIAADISKELELAPSTVNEHLKLMEGSGLVRKNDTGHKWIYYEITEKGKNLIGPKVPINVVLVLSVSVILAVFGVVSLYTSSMYMSPSYAGKTSSSIEAPSAEKISEGDMQSPMKGQSGDEGTQTGTAPSAAETGNTGTPSSSGNNNAMGNSTACNSTISYNSSGCG